ncbi:unnamed protein product [Rotaria sordida]|uniref:F-box domain-containing protein n=2 Tax=Rotaria sordida TaxID=392033 RepID=A0A814AXA9_9BILA|nr:unnamed protein product [Rotaria sordida]
MNQIKRQQDNIIHDNDNNKSKKLRVLTIDTKKLVKIFIYFFNLQILTIDTKKTYFEDLSNDLMYEIFDYLNEYDIYESFYDLNQRFKNLLIKSNLPIKIKFPSISKLNFYHYYHRIILPNKHRIILFHLTNPFTLDLIFSSSSFSILKFIRLQTLILDNMQATYLEDMIDYIIPYYIPNLSSLIIHVVDQIQIPTLKYCKITCETKKDDRLSFLIDDDDDDKYSPIETLIINDRIWLDEIHDILSYFSNLHRLSIDYLDGFRNKQLKIDSINLKSLTYVNLKVQCLDFNQFEQLIIDCKRFDNNNSQQIYHDLIDNFVSPFWIKRQWFFTHHHEQQGNFHTGYFYSTNPYKRKDYTLYYGADDNNCQFYQQINFDKINHIRICGTQSKNSVINYFPNVTELTFDLSNDSITIDLNRIFPLSKLTKLVIECYQFPFKRLIKLLYSTVNLNSLKICKTLIKDTEYELIQQSELFQMISNKNMIKNLVIDECCTLKHIQLFVGLCPRLQQLTSGMNRKEFLSIVQFLLSKNDKNIQNLSFLCVLYAPKVSLK